MNKICEAETTSSVEDSGVTLLPSTFCCSRGNESHIHVSTPTPQIRVSRQILFNVSFPFPPLHFFHLPPHHILVNTTTPYRSPFRTLLASTARGLGVGLDNIIVKGDGCRCLLCFSRSRFYLVESQAASCLSVTVANIVISSLTPFWSVEYGYVIRRLARSCVCSTILVNWRFRSKHVVFRCACAACVDSGYSGSLC
jgi:hypothetical protein